MICYNVYKREKWADACITRYQGAGHSAKEATKKMDRYELELIRDYVGGIGCGSHGDPSNCAEHDHR